MNEGFGPSCYKEYLVEKIESVLLFVIARQQLEPFLEDRLYPFRIAPVKQAPGHSGDIPLAI